MKEVVFVTGSSGFIGSHLIERLLDMNYFVIGLARHYPLINYLSYFGSPNYVPVKGDIMQKSDLSRVLNQYKPAIIFHLAAQALSETEQSSKSNFEINVIGTWNLLESARELKSLKKIIISSSIMSYGKQLRDIDALDFSKRKTITYDYSKTMMELMVQDFIKTLNLPIIIAKLGNVFGPLDLNFSRIVPYSIISCMNGVKIELRSDGRQNKTFLYIKDAVSAFIKIMEAPIEEVKGLFLKIENREQISILDLVSLICEKMNVQFDDTVFIQDKEVLKPQRLLLESNSIDTVLNWEIRTTINRGLDETIQWYQSFDLSLIQKKSL